MKNKAIILVLVLIMGFVMTGCNNGSDQSSPQNELGSNEGNEVIIQQYFASSAYVYDGKDDENGELMPPVKHTVECNENENIYMAAVNSLLTTPENDESYCTMVSEAYKINNITVGDGIAYVDFSSENLEGGTITEIVLVDQIVYTLSNSFTEIGAVQFTVDGQKAETLMGNVDISETFVADYVE